MYIHKKAPSEMLAWVLNTPLLFEGSSKIAPRKIAPPPSPNSNANHKPNPDPDRGQFSRHPF